MIITILILFILIMAAILKIANNQEKMAENQVTITENQHKIAKMLEGIINEI